jgi:cell division protein FtsB
MTWISDLAPVFISVGGLSSLAAVMLVPSQIKKIRGEGHLSEADAAAKLSNASIALLEPFRQSVTDMRTQVTQANAEVVTLKAEVASLKGQVEVMTKDLTAAHDRIRELEG